MIDDGQERDGPWSCSTPSVPLIAAEVQRITSLHLSRINKATVDSAVPHSRSLGPQRLRLQKTTCANLYSALKVGLRTCGCRGRHRVLPNAPSGVRHAFPIPA